MSEIQLARIRLAKAEAELSAAKKQVQAAKRRRKEAKQAARRAKKQAKLAKRELVEAKLQLSQMQEKLSRPTKRSPQTAGQKRPSQKARSSSHGSRTIRARISRQVTSSRSPGRKPTRRASTPLVPAEPATDTTPLAGEASAPITVPRDFETPGATAAPSPDPLHGQ